ncbi:MFS transporter [Mycolicibacterium sp. CH28]|uniref:MFS transporter n=1 Tax=Mycolicibacterium sp. CH28 TaxID=2512237 RepID=UPI0013870095|nr:MFS transporter [Mycolicibacterium sp. CH28]
MADRVRRWLSPDDGFDRTLIAPLVSGAVLNPINSTIVSVALVPIGVAFGEPPAATAWLISALYLATAVGQPVVGRLIDTFGPRRLFLPATALVGVAGLIGTAAPNLTVLIVARAVLGFGTCAGYPAAMRLIHDEADRTGKDSPAVVLTILAIATQTISVVGPALGGLLIGLGGWRATLAVNIPFAAVAFVLGWRRLPRDHPRGRSGDNNLDLDIAGMALFAGTLVALLLFLMNPHANSWYLLVICGTAAIGFVVRELRHHDPFIDVRVLGANVPLMLTYVRTLLAYVVSYSVLYGISQWLQDGRGLPASQAGLVTLPVFVTGIVVSAVTGRREELRGKLIFAALGQVVACALLLLLHPASPIWVLVVVMLIFGIPQGLNSIALQNAVYRQADPDDIGAAAGLLRTFGYLGAIIASAAQGGFYGRHADTVGMHHLAMFLVGVSLAFLLINVLDRSLTRTTKAATDGPSTQPGKGNRVTHHHLDLDPRRTALLVMDYQGGLVDRLPAALALLDHVATAVLVVRARGGHIVWVRMGFDDDEFDAIPPLSIMARAATPNRRLELHADAAATQIHHRLSPQPDDITVRKTRVGAFSTTDLDQRLKARAITTVILAGISTSGVVLSTVREAMDLDYEIIVLNDASADQDPAVHDFLTDVIFPRHTAVIDVADLGGLFPAEPRPAPAAAEHN